MEERNRQNAAEQIRLCQSAFASITSLLASRSSTFCMNIEHNSAMPAKVGGSSSSSFTNSSIVPNIYTEGTAAAR